MDVEEVERLTLEGYNIENNLNFINEEDIPVENIENNRQIDTMEEESDYEFDEDDLIY